MVLVVLALTLTLSACAPISKTETETLGWWCIGACAGATHEQSHETNRTTIEKQK